MKYSEELQHKKIELEEILARELRMLNYYQGNLKESQLKVEALQDQIDRIDTELRQEAIK